MFLRIIMALALAAQSAYVFAGNTFTRSSAPAQRPVAPAPVERVDIYCDLQANTLTITYSLSGIKKVINILGKDHAGSIIVQAYRTDGSLDKIYGLSRVELEFYICVGRCGCLSLRKYTGDEYRFYVD